jgi:hypothetical protein
MPPSVGSLGAGTAVSGCLTSVFLALGFALLADFFIFIFFFLRAGLARLARFAFFTFDFFRFFAMISLLINLQRRRPYPC